MNKPAPAPEQHYSMSLDDRRHLTLTGVTDVESFDETAVVLHTHGGRLIVTGKELHVSSLQLENGRLTVNGSIDAAVYDTPGSKRRGFMRRQTS